MESLVRRRPLPGDLCAAKGSRANLPTPKAGWRSKPFVARSVARLMFSIGTQGIRLRLCSCEHVACKQQRVNGIPREGSSWLSRGAAGRERPRPSARCGGEDGDAARGGVRRGDAATGQCHGRGGGGEDVAGGGDRGPRWLGGPAGRPASRPPGARAVRGRRGAARWCEQSLPMLYFLFCQKLFFWRQTPNTRDFFGRQIEEALVIKQEESSST